MVSLDNIDNLRVKDLRSELQKRGLDKNGVKATLAARLKRALDAEIAAIAVKDAEKLEEVHEDQSNILLEILEIVKSIDIRLKRLEEKKDVRDATTDTAFEEESDIVNNTIHHDSVEDHSDNHRQQVEIITVPTSNPFEVLAVQESSVASTTSTTTTTSAPSTSPPYQEQIEGYRQRHRLVSNKHDVVVVGDSMIKHIDGRRLSRHKKVKCVSFPGAKVRDIFTSSPCESLKPGGELIIHAGTNNISEGAAEVSHQITDLCKSVSAEGFSVSISTIIHRRWESAAERKRVDAINDLLESAASENRWGLVFNNTITEQHLGRDGVHLNRTGQRILASNLRRLINWDNSPTGSLPRPAGRQTQVRGGNQSLASSRSSPVRSYAEAVSGPGGSLDFSPVGQRSRLKLASRSSKVDMKDWEKYLHFVRRQTLSSFNKVHVVIGNEACDLDSTVSAITHAYHLSQDSQSGEEAIIPVLNIPRDELPLRTEITHLLPRCNIQLADLICRDEIDLKSVPNLTLTLVDHNVPAQGDTWLDEYVVEVIDHHVSSRHDDEGRVISITREMVGSCSTLVARQILDKHLEILDHQLVKLLLGTILLDTLNMSEAAGRTTPTDEDVVQRLGKLSPRINLQELFNDVQTAKFNISGLTTPQILRKDFKSASSASCKIGFSSVTLPLQDVLDREDLETSLQNFCEHRFLDMNIIMTIDFEGSRQLAIYSEDPILRETIEERLQGSVLELERIDSSVTNLSAFDQHNRKASRKVVLPLVEEILRTLDKDSDSDEEDEHGENGPSENREELSSNVNNANNMAEEGQQNGKAEALETGSRLLPMSPFDKKSISVDESVTKNLEEEWDEKEAILNAIRAKQEEAERRNMQLEDPSMRQVSLDSEDAAGKIQGVSVDDEWQDDEYSRQALQGSKNGVRKSEESDSFYRRPVPKDEREAGDGAEHTLTSDGVVLREKKLTRPNTLLNRLSVQSVNSVFSEGSIDLDNISDEDEAEAEKAHSQAKKSASKQGDPSGARPKEKRKIRAELSLNLDDTITSQHTDDGTTPAILTPTSTEMSWEDDTPMNKAEPIEEYTAREEHEDRWRWRKVNLGGKDYTIDMKAINPYKKVLSHGGYYGEGLNAIIVFASCYLPEKSKKDYTYIMNNLFLYVVSTLELLVAQEYIIIYFHGSASRAKIPSLGWMRKCYQMIDRKLRKSLKGLYLVHPTTWLKAIVQLTKPFISHKFSNKLKFVKSLAELKTLVSMEYVYVPEEVKRFDQNKNKGG